MVHSKQELQSAAYGWLSQAGLDLSNRFKSFLSANDADFNDVADALDIEGHTLDSILDGDLSDISAKTLIKLFIVNDLALEIKPISETPMGRMHGRGFDMPIGSVHDEWTHAPIHEAERENANDARPPFSRFDERQPRDSRGRFMSRRPIHRNVAPSSNNGEDNVYDNMSNDTLANIISRNLWDSEIDLSNATHEDLVNFIVDKEKRFANMGTHKDAPRPHNASEKAHGPHRFESQSTKVPSYGEPNICGDARSNGFIDAMINVVKKNPELAKQIYEFANDK